MSLLVGDVSVASGKQVCALSHSIKNSNAKNISMALNYLGGGCCCRGPQSRPPEGILSSISWGESFSLSHE